MLLSKSVTVFFKADVVAVEGDDSNLLLLFLLLLLLLLSLLLFMLWPDLMGTHPDLMEVPSPDGTSVNKKNMYVIS